MAASNLLQPKNVTKAFKMKLCRILKTKEGARVEKNAKNLKAKNCEKIVTSGRRVAQRRHALNSFPTARS